MSDQTKILYVENEQDIQTIARIALEKIGGFKLLMCSSGQEALDNVVDFAPDIILLDVMMPKWMDWKPIRPYDKSQVVRIFLWHL